ncbi:N-(5'-phosphoribosyl)anthranilate isomerase [Chachezhania sediminis]|uniref:N-(5'-phosphoribosyl)anthranilate isomerase n=1 Tax=Chachezhania sediminis TaxID=2599291 RepID=UPI00131C4E42|nr:N-(5'-phosphoribosyl)anthranilate isomerase [Chachezhania sediminis]
MASITDMMTGDRWLAQVFASTEARKGGIVKRQIRDVDRFVGREEFLDEVHRRGFQVLENGRHYVVFCNDYPIRPPRAKGL